MTIHVTWQFALIAVGVVVGLYLLAGLILLIALADERFIDWAIIWPIQERTAKYRAWRMRRRIRRRQTVPITPCQEDRIYGAARGYGKPPEPIQEA